MTQGDDQGKHTRDRSDRAAKAAAGAGFEFAASVAAFSVGGYFIDRWQGTSPLWTIVGALIGFVGGGYNLYKASRRLMSAPPPRITRSPTPEGQETEVISPASSAMHDNEHVPAFQDEKRKPRRDFGMFGREQPGDEDMAGEDEIRWPEGSGPDDTPVLDDEDDRP